MKQSNELTENLNRLHTTPMGLDRIRKNLSLGNDGSDIVAFCRERILSPDAKIIRKGKNYYVESEGSIITVNASSFTIITAHKSS